MLAPSPSIHGPGPGPAIRLLAALGAACLAFLGSRIVRADPAGDAPGSAVINEIHYEPAEDTEPGEFIELHNPGAFDVDLSGWSFSDGISYVFPPGSTLAAGEYLVVAQSPAFIESRYGVRAAGPYEGRLSNDGEAVELRSAGGDLEDRVLDMQRFAFVGGDWPVFNEDSVVGPGGRAAYLDAIAALGGDDGSIPNTPTVTAVGPPDFPITSLHFETTPFSDPQGAETFAAMEWRVAEVTDPGATDPATPAQDPAADPAYEWTPVWTSGKLAEPARRIAVPPHVLRVGRSYRIRVRMMDGTGRWGHWSEPVGFVPTLRATSSPGDVIITEFFANALGDDDGKEWLELFNATDAPIDLTGWEIADNDSDRHTSGGGRERRSDSARHRWRCS